MPGPGFRNSYRNSSIDSLGNENHVSQHGFQTRRLAQDSDSGCQQFQRQGNWSLLERFVSAANVRAVDTLAATIFPLPSFRSSENLLLCIPESRRPSEGAGASGSEPGS